MKISVIIPVYNKVEYIEKCLSKLVLQDFDSFEVICVDDGSTDNSGKICDEWATKDQRIHVVHTENNGVTAARRYGVSKAKGRYIVFADSDDEMLDGSLQILYNAIVNAQADEVIATFCLQDGKRSPIVYTGNVSPDVLAKKIIVNKNRFPILWGIIFQKEVLEGCLNTPREIIEGEDKLMQIMVLLKQPKVYFIPNCVYQYTVGLPNNRHRSLEKEILYDKILQNILSPRWESFKDTYCLHLIKEYEKFIEKGHDEVRDYYKQTIDHVPDNIPLYDRVVWHLTPTLARPLIWLYRKAVKYFR